MRKAAFVRPTDEQRAALDRRLEREALTGRQRRRLQILLLADRGQTDAPMALATGAGVSPGERLRKRFAAAGLEVAGAENPRRGAPATWDGQQEAMMVALACSDAPEGQARWSARLLAKRAVELEVVESVSESTGRRLLKKTRVANLPEVGGRIEMRGLRGGPCHGTHP
jgi:hypothetical protein